MIILYTVYKDSSECVCVCVYISYEELYCDIIN